MSDRAGTASTRAPLPPRWFIRLAWKAHRALFDVTRGRLGLWRVRGRRSGAMRVTTTGRRSGQERSVDTNLDAYARRRSTETAVVVLAPRLEPV
jgi:hypothetical protein